MAMGPKKEVVKIMKKLNKVWFGRFMGNLFRIDWRKISYWAELIIL